jgi:hypothetical protein
MKSDVPQRTLESRARREATGQSYLYLVLRDSSNCSACSRLPRIEPKDYYPVGMREIGFEQVVGRIRALTTRNEIQISEVPAPAKLAPYSLALNAEVFQLDHTGEEYEIATGRFVLLHDPEGQDGWSGNYRCVTYVRADVDRDMSNDPLLFDLGWTWYMESMAKMGVEMVAPSGTVTKVSSSSYGTLGEKPDEDELEIRASWTPIAGEIIEDHVKAWILLLEFITGLSPIPEGVAQLQTQRVN